MDLLPSVEKILEASHVLAAEIVEMLEHLNEEECAQLVYDLRKTGHQDFGNFLALRWEIPEE